MYVYCPTDKNEYIVLIINHEQDACMQEMVSFHTASGNWSFNESKNFL